MFELVLFAALAFALSSPAPVTAAFPGHNGRIAFTTQFGNFFVESFIHTINPDGSRLKQIDDNAEGAAYGPRGRRIAFSTPYRRGIRLRRADGTGRERRLTGGLDYHAEWSPSGGSIVFTRIHGQHDYRSELRIYHAGVTRRLTDGQLPAWSVSGQIAFTSRAELEDDNGFEGHGIYVISPDGSGLRRVVAGGSAPDWSPDGRRIVFFRAGFISTVRPDGSGLRRLRRGSDPTYSPDGRKVAYISDRGLMTMSSRGSNPRIVPNSGKPDPTGTGLQLEPDWQPRRRFPAAMLSRYR